MPPLLLINTFVDDAITSVIYFLFCFFITFKKFFIRLCTHDCNLLAK